MFSRLTRTAVLAAGVLAATSAPALADTFDVNKHGDHAPGACTASDCTLREAAIEATALGGDDRIKLPSSEPYRLEQSSALAAPEDEKGDLDLGVAFALGNGFKVVHPGSGLATIDASEADDRAFEVNGFLQLIRVKVRGGESAGGSPGGGISVPHGALEMKHSRVINNEAGNLGGGVYGDNANLVVTDSVIARNVANFDGGGIFIDPDGQFVLERTTISRNTAMRDGGGAVAQTALGNGSSRIQESTVARNEAVRDGGGVMADAESFFAINSTISKNRAGARGGGIYAAPDTLMGINSVTIARNRADADDSGAGEHGGGILADGGEDVVEIRNSLLVKNKEAGGAINECDAPAPVGILSLGGNLITQTTGGCTFLDDPEDLVAADPGIGKLTNAGGPTQTIPLEAGSPAIGEADGPNAPLTDQRGQERNNPDIGAYER